MGRLAGLCRGGRDGGIGLPGEASIDIPTDGDAENGARTNGIGTLNEGTLHAQIKDWLAQPGDQFEVPVDGFVVDIVRGQRLIEVQTRNFASIKAKLWKLTREHDVLLVHPIAACKWIVKVDPETGELLSRRRSPKRGRPCHLFDELIRVPTLINDPHFSLDILMTHEDEIRVADGKGSWRRKGVSIVDRRLIDVVERCRYACAADLGRLLPEDMPELFTNRDLKATMGVSLRQAQRISYCLARIGVIERDGKRGRAYLYRRTTAAGGTLPQG